MSSIHGLGGGTWVGVGRVAAPDPGCRGLFGFLIRGRPRDRSVAYSADSKFV